MRRHPVLAFTLIALLLPALVGPPRAVAVERPPRLVPQSGCELWVGRASGNDPSMQIELELCPQADGQLLGSLQWSSTLSGWNVRDLHGHYEPGGRALSLSDDRVRAERPAPGWRFCTVDLYTLERVGDHLSGRYHSSACTDDGTMSLDRVTGAAGQPAQPGQPGQPAQRGQPAQPGTSPPPSVPSPPSPAPTPPPPAQRPAHERFGCSL